MRIFSRVAAGVAAAATALAGYDGVAQQVRELTVPNVTVTAPAVPKQPPDISGSPWKAYVRNPFFGRYRVEEEHFAPVPCTETRIASAADASCLRGYRLIPGFAYNGGRDSPRNQRCDMALDVVSYEVANLSVEADVVITDPHKVTAAGYGGPDCYVPGYAGFDQLDFEDINQVTRRGAKWRNLQGADDDKSMEFTDGPRNCIAIRRHGPAFKGGYSYMLRASICHRDEADIGPADIGRALAALKIREYDPDGNLAPPPSR